MKRNAKFQLEINENKDTFDIQVHESHKLMGRFGVNTPQVKYFCLVWQG